VATYNIPQLQAVLSKRMDALIEGSRDEMLKNVKAETPFRTGRARSGWKKEGNDTLTNEVPYIRVLEYGGPRRQAHAMVRKTVMKRQEIVNKVARKVEREVK